jgi:hypothetical protein
VAKTPKTPGWHYLPVGMTASLGPPWHWVVTATTWGLFYDELRKWATQKTDRKEGDGHGAENLKKQAKPANSPGRPIGKAAGKKRGGDKSYISFEDKKSGLGVALRQ